MPSGRRTPLLVASAGVAVACAAAPWLTWLTVRGRAGHCGWTCYVPAPELPPSERIASLAGRTGTAISPTLSVLLLLLAVLAVVALVAVLRAGDVPAALGRVLIAGGSVALLWTVVLIVRYAEGGTLIGTRADGVFAADLGPGAIVALAGAAGGLLTGGAIALGTGWARDPRSASVVRADAAGREASARVPEGREAADRDAMGRGAGWSTAAGTREERGGGRTAGESGSSGRSRT